MNSSVFRQLSDSRGTLWRTAALLVAVGSLSVSPGHAQGTTPAAPAAGTEGAEETIVLSPFEVTAETTGYFQSNTMSGTRLNSKIEDLGQSITVMTKEQMSDFAMLDINDVFDHMASTEGTGSYSDFVLDRTGAVTDNVAGDPNNANRVRGIGNANIAFNNIQTTGRVPVDPLWLDSLELSRGPNANIFGLGNSSGTVNQVPATANTTRNFARLDMRVDSYGGWRTSIDVNRIILEDKLAVRASFAKQHTAFERKPSGEDARRSSLQLKARPFKNTTVSLSWYGYKNTAVRPNFTTPRDFITDWFEAGQPAWNPVTRLITIGGVTYGSNALVAGNTTPITTLPSYFSGHDARAVFRIGGNGQDPYWSTPTVTNTTVTAANPLGAAVNNTIRFVNTAASDSLFTASQPLFATFRPLADKSIYDWEKINLMANSKAWDDVNTYLAQLDQIIINSSKQTLAAQVTFMREDVERIEDLPMGPASVNSTIGEIHVDPNIVNLDGTPNPYFGRPYARTTEPFKRDKPQLWDTSRVQAVYSLDFSQDDGWTKWLGKQQLLGYYEYKDQQNRHYAWRNTAMGLTHPWQQLQFDNNIALANRATGLFNPTTGANWTPSNNYMRLFEQYYLGNTPGGGIEYGPAYFPNGATVPFVWGQAGNFRSDPTMVGMTPSPDGSGGNASTQTIVRTQGAVLQSTFLDGRLVTTFGLREDKVTDRNAPFATLTPDFTDFDFAASNQWNDASTWRPAKGQTKTASVVVRPFRDLGSLQNQRGAWAEIIRGLSLTYNKSDNFIPKGPAVDLFLNPLPNQTGTSEDFGFWVTLFESKLSIRYNHYRTDQINFRNGDISTIAQRVLRADGLNANDNWNLLDRATDWVTEVNDWDPVADQALIQAEVAETMGLPQATIDQMIAAIATGTLAATQDIVSNGDELEINYNPTPEWTISGSVTKTESINQNAGSTIEDWIALRMPIWESVEDPRFTPASPGGANIPTGANGNLLWRYIRGSDFTGGTYNYNATNSAATNFTTFVEGPLAVFRQLEGRPRPQLSKYAFKFNTRYQLSGITDNEILKNMSVGGSLRWNDKKAIGFYGVQSLPDRITQLDVNNPVYSSSETYVDLFASYRTRLFNDKVRATFQLNVKNIGESGGDLLVTQVFPDGTPLAYRILDPRQFILSASFDM